MAVSVETSSRFRRWSVEVAIGFVVAVIALLMWSSTTGVLFDGWAVPWTNGGDGAIGYSLAKNLQDTNGFLQNPRLGYPYIQDQSHYPIPDLYSLLHFYLLSKFVFSPIAAVNLAIALWFGELAFVTYLTFRLLGAARLASAATALMYTLLPWHFVRNPGHSFLGHYVSIPLALVLVAGILSDRLHGESRTRWMLLMIPCALIIGLNGVYYSLMTTIVLGLALLIKYTRTRFRRDFLPATFLAALVPASTLGAILLFKLSMFTVSVSDTVLRDPSAAQMYGGAIWTLWLPTGSESWPKQVLNKLSPEPMPAVWEANAFLSFGGAFAHILTAGVIVLALLGWRRTVRGSVIGGQWATWGAIYVVVLAFYATTGLGLIFSYIISDDIRAWGRYSIFLTGLAFLLLALVSTACLRSSYRFLKVGAGVALVALTAQSYFDIGPVYRVLREPATAVEQELLGLVGSMENELADGCPILQLPLVPFPEHPQINRMLDYSHFMPYLYSDDLRWSYGGLKGTTEGSWGFDVAENPQALADKAVTAGFCGALVDTYSFSTPDQLRNWEKSFGNPDLRSTSGRWIFFDLRDGAEPTAVVAPESGFWSTEQGPSGETFWWLIEGKGSIRVQGPSSRTVKAMITFIPTPCGPVDFELAGKKHRITQMTTIPTKVELDKDGSAVLPIQAKTKACRLPTDPRPLRLGLVDPFEGVTANNGEGPTPW